MDDSTFFDTLFNIIEVDVQIAWNGQLEDVTLVVMDAETDRELLENINTELRQVLSEKTRRRLLTSNVRMTVFGNNVKDLISEGLNLDYLFYIYKPIAIVI